MMKKNKLVAFSLWILLGFTKFTMAGPIAFAEINPFSTDTTQITGNIGGNYFTWSLVNPGTDDLMFIRSIPGNSTIFDNTSNTFASANYSPATSNIDSLSYLFTPPQGTGTFEVSFSNPVTNPTFHFYNLDRLLWDFSQTTTNMTLLRGNSEISVQNGIVRDMFPATFSGQNSADGSVMLLGTFASITGTFGHNPGSNGNNDSGVLQISYDVAEQTASVPEPSSILLFSLGVGGLLITISRRKTLA